MLVRNCGGFSPLPMHIRYFRNQISKLESNSCKKNADIFSVGMMDDASLVYVVLPDFNLNIYDPTYERAKDMVSQVAESISNDPIKMQGVVFQDISHLALDFSVFWVSSDNIILLRFVILIGRLCSLLSDYIPDHSMRPDELAFQSILLSISSGLLTRSIIPWVKAWLLQQSETLPQRRDVIAYRNLFEPVGINWIQFQMLLTRQALEWVDISIVQKENNQLDIFQQVNDNDNQTCLYWIYDKCTKSLVAPDNIGELAYFQFLRKLEKQQNQNYDVFSSNTMGNSSIPYELFFASTPEQNDRFLQNENKAILRVNSKKMIEAVEDNDDLDLSILILVVKCLQSKVTKSHESITPSDPPNNEKSYLIRNFNHINEHFSNKSSNTYFRKMESQDLYS